jgi:3'(2'), 5'-bisphosphate nucleotidase
MTAAPTDPKLLTALRVVAQASRVARRVQMRLDQVRRVTKDDRSPVTVADFAVQAIVSLALREGDSDVLIVGEERADLLRQPAQTRVLEQVVDAVRLIRPAVPPSAVLEAIDHCGHDGSGPGYWTLDPVDGTKGFLRGQQYAIALAWIEGGSVTHGVMGCPNLPAAHDAPLDKADPSGMLYAALAGGGAWGLADGDADSPAVSIAAASLGEDRAINICESVEAAHSKHSDTARIVEDLGVTTAPVRLDSQCKYAVVGRGQADAYLRLPTKKGYVEKIWDHAAGALIATEAGAVVSDVTGRPLDFSHGSRLEANRGVVCATAELHGRIIESIGRLGLGTADA